MSVQHSNRQSNHNQTPLCGYGARENRYQQSLTQRNILCQQQSFSTIHNLDTVNRYML